MKVSFFITARLKSTRLPLKLLKRLGGQTVFEHVVDRARSVKGVDSVIVCTSHHPQDLPLVQMSMSKEVFCFQGDERDVLRRLVTAARAHSVDYLLCITADNPLFSIFHAERLADIARREDADYYSVAGLPLGAAPYVVKRQALELVDGIKEEAETEYWPEYLKNKQIFRHYVLDAEPEYRMDVRLTLDYAEDFKLISTIYHRHTGQLPIDLLAALEWMRLNPAWLEVNSHIQRSWLSEERMARIQQRVEKKLGSVKLGTDKKAEITRKKLAIDVFGVTGAS